MPDVSKSWVRDILAVPLLVGLVSAVFAYFLPRLLSESRQLSYTVEEPVAYLDRTAIGSSEIKVNNVPVPEVFAVRIKVWNSGSLPLKALLVRFDFASDDKDFRILSVNHKTKPAKEFGPISEESGEVTAKRFTYSLLNPEDSDDLTFLTTSQAKVGVFSKAEGLSMKAVSPEKPWTFTWYNAAGIAALVSLLSNVIEQLFAAWRRRRRA